MAGIEESHRAALESALRLREEMVSSKLSSLDNSGAQSPQDETAAVLFQFNQ